MCMICVLCQMKNQTQMTPTRADPIRSGDQCSLFLCALSYHLWSPMMNSTKKETRTLMQSRTHIIPLRCVLSPKSVLILIPSLKFHILPGPAVLNPRSQSVEWQYPPHYVYNFSMSFANSAPWSFKGSHLASPAIVDPKLHVHLNLSSSSCNVALFILCSKIIHRLLTGGTKHD